MSAADLIASAQANAASMQSAAVSALQSAVATAARVGYSNIFPDVSTPSVGAVPAVRTIDTDLSRYLPAADDILAGTPELPSSWRSAISTYFPSATDASELGALFEAFVTPAYLDSARAAFVGRLRRELAAQRRAAAAHYAARGFSLAGGGLAGALAEVEAVGEDKIAEFEATLSAQHQDRWFSFVSELVGRYLDAQLASLQAWTDLVRLAIDSKLRVREVGAQIAEAEARLEQAVCALEQERYRSVLAASQLKVSASDSANRLAIAATEANNTVEMQRAQITVSGLSTSAKVLGDMAAAAISSALGVATEIDAS